ncbi:hypothetical protein [Clostridium estertheticum]|nr:hypothetical protein [Clostridium estertheticum]WLC82153.1 hypothetical protein KTC98_23430 [Clostridium estertheticum]
MAKTIVFLLINNCMIIDVIIVNIGNPRKYIPTPVASLSLLPIFIAK